MKVCYLGDANSIHGVRLVEGLRKRGVAMCAVSTTPVEEERPYPVRSLQPRRSILGLWADIRSSINALGPDVVHANYIDHFAVATQFAGRPSVLTAWGSDLNAPWPDRFTGLNRTLKRAAWTRTFRRARVCTALTDRMRDQLIGLGVREERIMPFRLGVPEPVAMTASERRALRQAHGADDNRIVFFSARACAPLYNVEKALLAFMQAFDETAPCMFWYSTFGADPAYADTVSRLARTRPHQVRQIPPVTHEKLSRLLGAADVMVSVPDTDGLPVTVMQAMAQGVAILWSDVPSLDGLLTDGIEGFRIQPSEDAIATAMKAMAVPGKASNMGKASARTFAGMPSANDEMDRLADAFRSIVAGRE